VFYLAEWIGSIKSSLGVYWEIIFLFAGAFLGVALPYSYNQYKSWRKRRFLKKTVQSMGSNEELNIQTLCSSIPAFQNNALQMYNTNIAFYLAFPYKLREQVLTIDEDFEMHDDWLFNESNTLTSMGEKMEISNFEALINKHRAIVANYFINETNGCKFNRPKYGVYSIRFLNGVGKEEEAGAKIELYDTDYFTHRVMRSVYNELKEQGNSIATIKQGAIRNELFKYNLFTTSIGINIFLLMDSIHGESIIFSRRSANAAHEENQFKYNSTIMEGISKSDYEPYEKRVSLQLAARRALNEELGIGYELFNPKIRFHDIFLERNYLEIGLTASVEIEGIFEESVRDLPAKDKELELDRLVPIPLATQALNQFVKQNIMYNQGLYTLKMIAARHNINITYRKTK
jgi:hypothetical protein